MFDTNNFFADKRRAHVTSTDNPLVETVVIFVNNVYVAFLFWESLMYIRKSSGPNIESYGTLVFTGL